MRDSTSSWLLTARRLLEEEGDDAMAMSRIAAAVGVHPVHLSRAYRRAYGMTMLEHRRRLRVQRACHALATSGHSLSRIALAAGFADHAHFARTFRRTVGLTPSAFRRAVRDGRIAAELPLRE